MSKGRNLSINPNPVYSRFGRRRSAATPGAFWHLPAFLLLACTPLTPPENPVPAARKAQIYIYPSGKTNVQGLDLLFFQDGPLFRLDAYQHLDGISGNRVTGTSSTAARKVVILSNYPPDTYPWSGIRSLESLADLPFRLQDEDPAAPMLYGTSEAASMNQVVLRPMLARITLRSIACDFSGRAYTGERLQDVRAYLTNAPAECRPFAPEDRPAVWLNAGRLDETETAALTHPENVFQPLTLSLGGRIYPSADFYCYPNPSDGSEFGSPVTRLVIEGKLRGTTYYYPIDLPGLEANVQYAMDVTLMRAGTTDPDTPAVASSIRLDSQVLDWDGREWEDIHYR
jgi:hypothetical protein